MKIPSKLFKFFLVTLIFASVPGQVLCSELVQIEYNPITDRLTVKAEDASFGKVLALVSHQTGIWVRMDQSIEKRITTNLSNISLESMLRRLSRGLSHSMFYERLDNGGHRLEGIEIVSNGSVPGRRADTRFFTGSRRGGSLSTYKDLRDNNSPQPDPLIYDQGAVDNPGIGSRPDMAPEQSSDMAIAGIAPVDGDAGLDESAGDVIPIDSNNEKFANTSDEKIVSPKGGATTSPYEKSY